MVALSEPSPAELLAATAQKLNKTPREVCEAESEILGTAIFLEFEETGQIPLWLQVACRQKLDKADLPRAENLLDRAPLPVMGLGKEDLEADANC